MKNWPAWSGLPPRVRGKAEVRHERDQEPGITPACAGKSCPLPRRTVSVRDHPRVCGEKRPDWKNEVELVGSPPRVRGKDAIQRHPSCGFGITPACAGKSAGNAEDEVLTWDHPRVCGEKASPVFFALFLSGSPPRVRGKGSSTSRWERRPWITPACAGKRASADCGREAPEDHPRVCGEKFIRLALPDLHRGSPPRVRGKGYPFQHPCCLVGITPACAGKSRRCCPPGSPHWDHPRVCGEKATTCAAWRPISGSPPRVRGKVPPFD